MNRTQTPNLQQIACDQKIAIYLPKKRRHLNQDLAAISGLTSLPKLTVETKK